MGDEGLIEIACPLSIVIARIKSWKRKLTISTAISQRM